MSVKSKMRKMQTSLFPSPEGYLSPEQREDFFEELFSESVSTRLRPLTEKERSARTRTSRSDGLVEAVVTRKYEREVWELYRLLFLNVENYDTFEVRVTPEHPFWVLSHGGGKGRYIPVKDLEIGMRCISTSDTPIQLLEKELLKFDEPVKVYNLEVEKAHNYFVGNANGTNVLVHNQCGPETPATPEPEKVAEQLKKLKNNPQWIPYFSSIIAHWSGTVYVNSNPAIEKMVQHLPALYVDMAYAGKAFSGAGTGDHMIYDSKPNSPEFVGTRGMGPCIGVVIYSPSTGARAAFHFSQTDSAASTLFRYVWPPDCRAIIAGAYDGNQTTKMQLAEVLGFMRTTGMKVDGFISGEFSAEIYVDRKGNWIVVPTYNYVQFVNGPPPTLLPK